jgi:DNA (cytosine-5)-methyltransferase 1
MNKPRLLDLFCGAGGAAMGYSRAGFEVVGVDNKPQPHYPFEFHQADALTYPLEGFDAYHASPKCELFSGCVHPAQNSKTLREKNPDQITPMRVRLLGVNQPFVIENVPGSPLVNYHRLDGTMFGLNTIKERWFECHGFEPPLFSVAAPFNADGLVAKGLFAGIMRHGKNSKELTKREHLAAAYKIDWHMTREELREAIPPAYTEYIGKYLMQAVLSPSC